MERHHGMLVKLPTSSSSYFIFYFLNFTFVIVLSLSLSFQEKIGELNIVGIVWGYFDKLVLKLLTSPTRVKNL